MPSLTPQLPVLSTASPYGCNDNISSIGNLTSPLCSNSNVMTLFPSLSRRKRSHGHRHHTPARLNEISFDELLPLINEPLGLLNYILFHWYLCIDCVFNIWIPHTLINPPVNTNSTASFWILLIIECFNQLNQIFRMYLLTIFFKLEFANKGIDALNIGHILNH